MDGSSTKGDTWDREKQIPFMKYTTAPVAAMRSRVLGSMPTVNGWTRNAACKEGKPQPVGDVEEALKIRHINAAARHVSVLRANRRAPSLHQVRLA